MVGLNARSEPQGLIKAIFELFDEFKPKKDRAPMMALTVLKALNAGTDLPESLFKAFMDEYFVVFNTTPMKQYGSRLEPIAIGSGGREYPPNRSKNRRGWPDEEWRLMNVERATRWNVWIREEMTRRIWTEETLFDRYQITLLDLPAPGFKLAPVSAEDRVAKRVQTSNEILALKFEAAIEQSLIVQNELAALNARMDQLTAMVRDIHGAIFTAEEKQTA